MNKYISIKLQITHKSVQISQRKCIKLNTLKLNSKCLNKFTRMNVHLTSYIILYVLHHAEIKQTESKLHVISYFRHWDY